MRREQIEKDLLEVGKRLKRANAHADLEQVGMLLGEYDKLLDALLELRRAKYDSPS